MTVATRLQESVEKAREEFSKLYGSKELPPATVEVDFSKAQRKFLAGMFPDLTDSLAIEQAGVRSVSLPIEKLIETAETLESAKQTLSGSQKNAATKSLKAIEKSVGNYSEEIVQVVPIYQLRIELEQIEPTIWRQFTVPDCTLFDLHHAIQTVMGWENDHMFAFSIKGTEYFGSPIGGSTGGGQGEDAEDFLLSEVLGSRTKKFRYQYDFGDSWNHTVRVESATNGPLLHAARCLAGENACPPEDCGGIYGYYELIEALGDPELTADDDERLEWYEDYDPESFDLQRANNWLASMFK